MQRESIESLPDGCVRVCLSKGDKTLCTTVSSHHLVEDKWRQLRAGLNEADLEADSSH